MAGFRPWWPVLLNLRPLKKAEHPLPWEVIQRQNQLSTWPRPTSERNHMRTSRISGQKSALERRAGLSRRHFLRGVGACLALPALGSLAPWKLVAAENAAGIGPATTATGAPLRTAFIFFPNGAIQPAWWPGGEGADFKLNATLQ